MHPVDLDGARARPRAERREDVRAAKRDQRRRQVAATRARLGIGRARALLGLRTAEGGVGADEERHGAPRAARGGEREDGARRARRAGLRPKTDRL